MNKFIFTVALLITFIFIPPLVFSDPKTKKVNFISATPSHEIKNIPRDSQVNPQYTIETNDTNSESLSIIDDGLENREQIEVEFRVCG